MKHLRSLFRMQTVRERARREQADNVRAIFEAEKALLHTRQELAYLLKRQVHLNRLVEAA